MKHDLDPNIFESTLDFLNERIDLHRHVLLAARSEKDKAEQELLIEDCEAIRDFFVSSFDARRRSTKGKAGEA